MNICTLASELKFVNKIGQTLSPEERINLELAVSRLSQQYRHEGFNFWGRIEGVHKNYYIVEGVTFQGTNGFPSKQYFWRYNALTQLGRLQIRIVTSAQDRLYRESQSHG